MSGLVVDRLVAGYGRLEVLHGIGLRVEPGQVTVLLGANGAGKTTALRSISGLCRAAGRIAVDGVDVLGRQPDAIARLGVAHVPQGRGTITQLTVAENLHVGALGRRGRAAITSDFDRVVSLFPRLAERSRQQAGLLSGGEQQMLAIGRALMLAPRYLLLDEPSLGLAPLVVRSLFETLSKVRAEFGVGILLAEQNADLALDLADTASVLESGTIVLAAEPQVVRDDPTLRRAFLGGD